MADSNIITTELYPMVKEALDKNSKKFIQNIGKFINAHYDSIYDVAPYDRIYYNATDVADMFNSIGLQESDVINVLKKCFFWDIDYTPAAACEPYVEVLMCAIRYYASNSKSKEAELTTIYTLFSGKFYASLHSYFWKFPPNKQVMDYVINNMLSDKFDLKKEGTLFGAIKKLAITWLGTYKSKITGARTTDDNYGKLIQQLRDREKSFLKNISSAYYEANENKYYLNYETDNLAEDGFRLTSNDAATAARITEAAMGILTSQRVNINICNTCKNASVSSTELKGIIEAILSEKENLPSVRRVINIIICDFMANFPGQPIGGAKFISNAIKPRPNTKNQLLIEMKQTIVSWLDENSASYRKRKSREATANDYYRSVLTYLVLIISKSAM